MSSFDDFYKKWKEKNEITTDTPYQNLTDEQKAQSAMNSIDNFFEKYKATNNQSNNTWNNVSTNSNKTSLWDTIRNIADGTGKVVENGWLSFQNGLKSAGQTIGKAITNTQAERVDFWNQMNKESLEKRAKEHPEEAEKIKKMIENPLLSGEQIRKESEETTQKIQKEKEENNQKVQENADNINNPVGKYLAGNIVPAIGQMLPGIAGGGVGTTYFISSATGNYYDDAKQRGMTDDEATMYSGTMGIIEGSLESLGAKLTTNVGKQLLKKNIKGALVNYGLDIGENFLEESIVEPISELVAQTTAGKDKANWENIGQRFLQSGIDGAVTSMITGGVSGIIGGAGSKLKQNKYTDVNTGKLLNKNSQNWLKEAENIINENKNINSQQNTTINQNNQSTQQTIQEINKMAQNGNMEQILPTQNYYYEKSDNTKIDNLRKDVNKYWDNSEKTKNYVNMLEKIIQDKNIDIRLDANLKDSNGNIANGSYSNGVITINPNSNRAGEFIAIHELTHAIGTDQMKNIVQKYRQSNLEFDTAVKSLLQNYNTTELTEEAMADVAGQLFGNQEFINNLAKTEPNIFKKIYNEIKYLWHQFTGYKNQDQFIKDLQYKWEQAYRNNNNLSNTTNYSFAGRKSLENIRDNTILYNSGISSYNQAQQMSNQNISNEQIRQKTGWFQDKNGDWKYEFSDKDMSIKENIKLQNRKTYKLGDILKHDTLFELYPELKQLIVRIDNTNKISGNYNKNSKTITLSNQLLKNRKRLEGTLIHEIQHTIQEIENFENGTTSKLSKERYYNSLGEIEADNTRKRFIDEKYNNKDIKNEAPESSKANPKHRNYDNYINNRTTLDKVKDSMFKYFKGLGDSNEVFQKNNQKNIQQDIRLVDDGRNGRYLEEYENNPNKVILKDGKAKYIDESGGENDIYFRFDDIDGFKGKEHKSGISMWEERVDNLISENYEMEYDENDNFTEDNVLLKKYDISQEEYNNMSYEEQLKVKREIAEDEGFITNGASVYDLTEDGLSFFNNYHETHTDGYPEVNFFTGTTNGYGADGENIVIPNKTLLKISSEQFESIIENIEYNDEFENATQERKNIELIKRLGKLIENEIQRNDTKNKYSLPTKKWQQYLEENYEPTGTRTNLKDIKLPTKETSKKVSINLPTKTMAEAKVNLLTKENINQPTQRGKIDWNTIERPEGKIRKHYQSIIQSGNTTVEAKAIAKELMGTDTYVPDSNNKQLERANERIQNSTPESELNSLMSRATTGGKIDATDIAVGEKLIQYYSMIGDKAKLQESIQATAMAGTTAGRTVQAMSLLNHQTPEGQAIWIQRSVEKLNNQLKQKKGEKAQQFDFTAEMQEKIIKSKDKVELEKNLNEVYEELGQQVSKSLGQQIDSWRYFSMLGNPKTHIRNMVGNFLMGRTQDVKNKVAGIIEGTVAKFNPDMERTHTVKKSSREVLDFAKDDIKNVADRLGLNDNKYNPKNRLENNMRTFKSDVMENTLGRMFKWNDNLLEAEDGLGLKAGYKKALAEYITANNIDINNITDKQLSKARNYAVQQAQERTFHQANTIASAINSFFRKNKATKAIGDAILPFVKTPANVAKTGIEYSPAGLVKSIVYDTVQLRKGNINVNQYIDNISKGLTGSAITVLGFALAQAGILKASGSDNDKKEKFDEQSGKQAYSIQIGDNTYTIDWLAPVGIPLMVGAEIYEGLSQKSNEKKTKSSDDEDVVKQFWDKAEVLANSLSNTLDPMVEMSMISGLTSTVRSFAEGDTQALGNMLTNGAKSYVNQFIPTLSGQIAKTIDTVERDTTSTKNGTVTKVVDSTVNQIKSKIPGLRQTLPTKKDIWGNDLKLADNWAQRFFEAGILPTNSKVINKDKVVTELNNLYDKIGESSILPTIIDKTFTIDGQKYRMTNEEYNKYKTNYGKTSYELIKNLVSSREYSKMNNEQKQKAIENSYSYAKESNKLDYAKSNKLECEQSTLYTTMEDLKKNGGSQSEYLSYLGKITEIKKDKEKNQILADSSYTAKTKSIIYKNTTGKEDELYNNILLKDNININEYLNYKLQEFESDKKNDGTIQGKAISGSKKKKMYEYVNNMNITPQQRIAILGTQYKLNRAEQKVLYDYLNKIQTKTQKEKLDIFSKYSSNFTIYKDNTLDFK